MIPDIGVAFIVLDMIRELKDIGDSSQIIFECSLSFRETSWKHC